MGVSYNEQQRTFGNRFLVGSEKMKIDYFSRFVCFSPQLIMCQNNYLSLIYVYMYLYIYSSIMCEVIIGFWSKQEKNNINKNNNNKKKKQNKI